MKHWRLAQNRPWLLKSRAGSARSGCGVPCWLQRPWGMEAGCASHLLPLQGGEQQQLRVGLHRAGQHHVTCSSPTCSTVGLGAAGCP